MKNSKSQKFGMGKEKPVHRRKLPTRSCNLEKKRPTDTISACKRRRIVEKPEIYEEAVKKESDDRVELDERTAQILDEELQAVMIKVWQSLPDEPPSPAEKYVAERLRNEASDDIRNVLGLNVTKRLLNIYNPLVVIVHFTTNPLPAHLKQFMKTYNIQKMKQHAHRLNLHVATMSCIADFDKLCTAKNVRCGDAVVNVKPTYRFTVSPAKLKSVFTKQNTTASKSKEDECSGNLAEGIKNNKNDEDFTDATPVKEQVKNSLSNNDQAQSLNVESKNTVQNETSKSNDSKKQESIQNVTPNKKADSEKSASQDNVSTNKPNRTEAVSKTSTATNNSKPIQTKQEVVATNKVTAALKAADNTTATRIESKPNQGNQKIVETKKLDATPKLAQSDSNPTKPSPNQNNNRLAATKNVTAITPRANVKNNEIINATKPTPNQKTTQDAVNEKVSATTPKPTVRNDETAHATKPNPNQNKPQVAATKKITATALKPFVRNSETTNASKQVAATKKVSTSPKLTVKSDSNAPKPKVNQNTKVATKKTTEPIPKSSKKSFETINSENFDENDEMDDEEILALISSGVVLDECSGSDEE